ncbi:MAG: UDP-N-acetylglucosamine 2-epimerase (non-hydrolyzing) [Micrococcales bacterium]|nr:UDP-N-acetylglucosamine 2-epimerase (non-hydrolyzing) [Micrococcales bacterium]
MKVLSVVGARPQFVKLGPVARALAQAGGVEHVIVHTGQHYDAAMSDVFFEDLQIPAPDVHLGVGSGSHGAQTGAMLAGLDPVLQEHRPDWVLVYGDTNSTLAAAVSAVKLHLPIAHLEAGLRSFNRRMPEEHNRVLTDHAADLLLAPTQVAMDHLAHEGLAQRSVLVGDVMTDVCYLVREQVADRALTDVIGAANLEGIDLEDPYLLATIHRPDNTDSPQRLRAIVEALRDLPAPVVLLAHPRLVAKATEYGIELFGGTLHGTSPLAYPQMVRAVMGAAGVVTDSGGLQKEAFLLRTPCTTIRPETEWVETLEAGWNILDNDLTQVREVAVREAPFGAQATPYGDGHAADLVAKVLLRRAG